MEIRIHKTELVSISKEEQIKVALNLLESHFDLGGKFVKDGKVFMETRHGNDFVREASEADKAAYLVCSAIAHDIVPIYR